MTDFAKKRREELSPNYEIMLQSSISYAQTKFEEWKRLQKKIIDCYFVSSDGSIGVFSQEVFAWQKRVDEIGKDFQKALQDIFEIKEKINRR